ncbi:hypothetical protein [Psychromarinibacter sp. S121]
MKQLLVAGILALTPAALIAQDCHTETTQTCAEGMTYDDETKACVEITS